MTDLDPRGQRRRRTLQAVAALGAIGALGEQVLDLETLASHKGSVLGALFVSQKG